MTAQPTVMMVSILSNMALYISDLKDASSAASRPSAASTGVACGCVSGKNRRTPGSATHHRHQVVGLLRLLEAQQRDLPARGFAGKRGDIRWVDHGGHEQVLQVGDGKERLDDVRGDRGWDLGADVERLEPGTRQHTAQCNHCSVILPV